MAESEDADVIAELDRLRRKKQRNVQEQVRLRRLELLVLARECRQSRTFFPPALAAFFQGRGIDSASAILTRLEGMLPCCVGAYRGQWLTAERRFIDFDIDLGDDGVQVSVNQWDDVTDDTPISTHVPGSGHSWGYLCLEILNELNERTHA